MDQNEGTLDRVIRVALGLGLLSLMVVGPQSWWGMIGVLPAFTGIWGHCPLYGILGVRTCPAARSRSVHSVE